MSELNRAELFAKLNPLSYQALEAATAFCKLRGHSYVELVHWVHHLLHSEHSDWPLLVQHFKLDGQKLTADVLRSLERLPKGASAISDLSSHIDMLVESAWVYASLKLQATQLRSAHLLIALLNHATLAHVLYGISAEFKRIHPDDIDALWQGVLAASVESQREADINTPPLADTRSGSALGAYAQNLSAKARAGQLDPVLGRDDEIRQMIDVLLRRRQNNPLLAGEAGVGKTAVVEGLAQRLVRGEVPPALQNIELYQLDIGLLQAGASMKGEFEKRLVQLIEEVQQSTTPIILFIDEIHTLIGAGGAEGTGDAANLLKPALARGQLRTIGATTWTEYKKHIEKDPALTRRFEVVQVNEPTLEQAQLMLRGVAAQLSAHHQVLILDEAIRSAVQLSKRYIPARQLPDKAVALLDTACARVAVSQHSQPAELERALRWCEQLEAEHALASQEWRIGIGSESNLHELSQQLLDAREQADSVQQRWEQEREVVMAVVSLQQQLRELDDEPHGTVADEASVTLEGELEHGETDVAVAADAALETDLQTLQQQLREQQARLDAMQAEQPLVFAVVDAPAVAAVVANWTGIPVGNMVKDELDHVLNLSTHLKQRVIGQDHALAQIALRIQSSRARVLDPDKPVGVFLLCGPSGVGKTETALALADSLYGGQHNVITINMSEFQEAHTVSGLKGAPPGYVGYGEGGRLTEAVRRKPYSVVLLDEIEKAHPDVHELFFQVFDKGWMEDGEGRRVDFRNTIILLTSNVGTEEITQRCQQAEAVVSDDELADALRPALLTVFPPALLGRMAVIPYFPLDHDGMAQIARLQLQRLARRVQAHYGAELLMDEPALELLLSQCAYAESGGRLIEAMMNQHILPELSQYLLTAALDDSIAQRIELSARDGRYLWSYLNSDDS